VVEPHRRLGQRARGTGLPEASRADIEAFMGDLLARRSPSTAATYRKDLRILVRLA
jgi:hypothetical protein